MLVGRGNELELVDRLLADAADGSGGALLLTGEPGIGKTALVQESGARARESGMSVTAAVGIESEARLPFAALIDLVQPLGGTLNRLESRAADALRTAVEPTPGPGRPGDRLAVFAGFLELAVQAAAEQPLLLLVDDAQWLDLSSAECLGYISRRIDRAPVAILAAERSGSSRLQMVGATHELGQLSRADARLLLTRATGPLGARRETAILDAASGNPLALRELPNLLGEDTGPSLDRNAPGGALGAALRERIESLSEPENLASVAVAASFDSRAAPIASAASELGAGPETFEALEALGLLVIEGARIEFVHPLLRGIVYRDADPKLRRKAHRALAAATALETRAWHLAAAAIGFDDEAAAALGLAAADATARGAHDTAADALSRAAELSASPEGRSQRLLGAGLAAAMGGDFGRGSSLLERAAENDDPSMRAAVVHLDAMMCLTGGLRPPEENQRRLTQEAERIETGDPRVAMVADAAVIAVASGDLAAALGLAERALHGMPESVSPTVCCQVHSILGMALVLRGRATEARESLDVAGTLLEHVDPLTPAAQSILFAMGGRLSTGQEAQLLAEATRLAKAARRTGSVGLLPYFQLQRADAAYRLGKVGEALADSGEAVEIARESRQQGPLAIALAIRSRALAANGSVGEARQAAREGVRLSAELGYRSPEIWNLAALGYTELVAGRPKQSIASLEQVAELSERIGFTDPLIVPWAADLVEAYASIGAPDDAARIAEMVSEQASASGLPLARALAARCRALVVEDGYTEDIQAALTLHDQTEVPLERARTLLAQGRRLQAEGRRGRARSVLREARDRFDAIGARGWRRRAEVELKQAGAGEGRKPEGRLTEQESQIAVAVAAGATNREVAAELVVSEKTVEYHLTRIYRKLGIRSRVELAAMASAGKLGGS